MRKSFISIGACLVIICGLAIAQEPKSPAPEGISFEEAQRRLEERQRAREAASTQPAQLTQAEVEALQREVVELKRQLAEARAEIAELRGRLPAGPTAGRDPMEQAPPEPELVIKPENDGPGRYEITYPSAGGTHTVRTVEARNYLDAVSQARNMRLPIQPSYDKDGRVYYHGVKKVSAKRQ